MLTALVIGCAGCGSSDDPETTNGAWQGAQTAPDAQTDNDQPTKTQAKSPTPTPALLGDKSQARDSATTVDEVYDELALTVRSGIASLKTPVRETIEAADDEQSLTKVCDLMSEGAQQRTITYVERSAGLADIDWTCEKAVGVMLHRAEQNGTAKRSLQPRLVGVNAEGDRATATVRFRKNGPITTIPLIKEDGQWKLGSAPAGAGR